MPNFPELKTSRLLSDEEMTELKGGADPCRKGCQHSCINGCSDSCTPGNKTTTPTQG